MERGAKPEECLGQANFDKVSGFFHQSLGFKNTILRESGGGDPVKGRAQKIALVTDTRSGCDVRPPFPSNFVLFFPHSNL